MSLKWEEASKTMFRLIDEPDVFDTGWRVSYACVKDKGRWVSYHKDHEPVWFDTEGEAKTFAASTYVLESSNERA